MEKKTDFTRKEIYDVITKAIDRIKTVHFHYICNELDLAFGVLNYVNIFKVIPELIKYKPINKAKSGAWFLNDEDGRKRRIEILTELQEIYSE